MWNSGRISRPGKLEGAVHRIQLHEADDDGGLSGGQLPQRIAVRGVSHVRKRRGGDKRGLVRNGYFDSTTSFFLTATLYRYFCSLCDWN